MLQTQRHPFHIVDNSPWPIYIAVGLLNFTLSNVLYFHQFKFGGLLVLFAFSYLSLILIFWWRDIIRESTFLGEHTKAVQQNLKTGMLIFILSEVMFFFGLFWAFFHSALVPDIHIGCIWPPIGINPINPWGFPFANTLILLTSGASLTWTHKALLYNNSKEVFDGFHLTLLLALLFTIIQLHEYILAPFSINDSIYGSIFFILTGFHGLHVIIGTCFLTVCYFRLKNNHLLIDQHLNLILAAWYWHFVDVIWILLFLFVYWWGGK